MPFFLLPLIAVGIKCACGAAIVGRICYCAKKAHDAYKEGQKTKRQRLDLKGKTSEGARKDNEVAYKENDEWKKKYDELDDKIKKRDEEIKKFQNKLRDPNLGEKERREINNQLAVLLSQQEEDIKERDSISDKLKKLAERIKKNNEVISSAGSNSDDSHWIWKFLTLENIVIMGVCYAMYKILKDDK